MRSLLVCVRPPASPTGSKMLSEGWLALLAFRLLGRVRVVCAPLAHRPTQNVAEGKHSAMVRLSGETSLSAPRPSTPSHTLPCSALQAWSIWRVGTPLRHVRQAGGGASCNAGGDHRHAIAGAKPSGCHSNAWAMKALVTFCASTRPSVSEGRCTFMLPGLRRRVGPVTLVTSFAQLVSVICVSPAERCACQSSGGMVQARASQEYWPGLLCKLRKVSSGLPPIEPQLVFRASFVCTTGLPMHGVRQSERVPHWRRSAELGCGAGLWWQHVLPWCNSAHAWACHRVGRASP